jgi:hypothetical protein
VAVIDITAESLITNHWSQRQNLIKMPGGMFPWSEIREGPRSKENWCLEPTNQSRGHSNRYYGRITDYNDHQNLINMPGGGFQDVPLGPATFGRVPRRKKTDVWSPYWYKTNHEVIVIDTTEESLLRMIIKIQSLRLESILIQNKANPGSPIICPRGRILTGPKNTDACS